MAQRILLVEDEENLLKTIKLNLELENFHVTPATNGIQALKEFNNARFDLVVLDVMLPEIDGFDVCRQIRMRDTQVPVLFLTAKSSSEDKIQGLRIGADDYLTKPFNLEELLLRVQNLVKRTTKNADYELQKNSYQLGPNNINFLTYEIVSENGESQKLSKREILLLKLLIERKNEVVSREQILERVWGYDVYPSTRTIDNYILNLRKYLESNPKEPRYIHSIRGVGYKFTEPE